MTAIKIKKRHIRYVLLAVLLGTVQIFRTLENEAIPIVADGYGGGTYILNNSNNMLGSTDPKESSESAETYISCSYNSPNQSFSGSVFSNKSSHSRSKSSEHSSNDHQATSQATNNIVMEGPATLYVPVEENRKAPLAGAFTRQYGAIGKFAAAGMPSGGEEVLVPNPPPEPESVPLDSISLAILLIGLGVGSLTILKANKQKASAINNEC